MGRNTAEGRSASRLKLPRYVKHYIDRNGKARFYYRRAGVKEVPLPGLPWSPSFMQALQKAHAAYKAPDAVILGASRTVAGTVNAGLVAYYQSTAFKSDLGQSTQGARRNLLERFRVEHGQKRLTMLERRHVQAYIDALSKATIQRSMLQALRGFLAYCVSIKIIADNPAEGVTRAKVVDTGGFRPWTEEDVVRFTERHPIGTKARLALALYLNLGVRKSDVVRIGPRDVKNGELTDFQPKKGERTGGNKITMPLFAETAAIIKATPVTGADTYLVTEFGKAFTAKGFGNKMRQWCDQAGLPDCASHGLRKLCLIRLAEAGRTVFEIAAISGHKNLKEIQTYVDAANRKKLARAAFAHVETVQNENGRLSNGQSRLDKI
jgi:integrase